MLILSLFFRTKPRHHISHHILLKHFFLFIHQFRCCFL
uniref:Uncharacterized protein n=1 Tax=Podoviridae sp. ct2m58 TaxID=2827721 RepID=A0A8S5TME1_9CAUD|nr:MAG TPA: hypothetical protein [Podoviridae sp. ct2m58]